MNLAVYSKMDLRVIMALTKTLTAMVRTGVEVGEKRVITV